MRFRKARGFALITAIFLITVLVALAVTVATIATSTQEESAQSLLSAKVYYGAKAGLDWGIQQAVTANNTTLCPATGATGTSGSIALTQGGLNGISVTVTCVRQNQGSAATGNQVFYLVSTAQTTGAATGSVNFVERQIRASVSNIP